MTSACKCLEEAAKVCDVWAQEPLIPGRPDTELPEHAIGHMQCATQLGKLIRALPCSCACVPAGSVVVPVEPSKRMLTASYYPDVPMEKRREIYKAMLAASQKVPHE